MINIINNVNKLIRFLSSLFTIIVLIGALITCAVVFFRMRKNEGMTTSAFFKNADVNELSNEEKKIFDKRKKCVSYDLIPGSSANLLLFSSFVASSSVKSSSSGDMGLVLFFSLIIISIKSYFDLFFFPL